MIIVQLFIQSMAILGGIFAISVVAILALIMWASATGMSEIVDFD